MEMLPAMAAKPFEELAHGMEMEDVRCFEPSPPPRCSTCMIFVICTISHVMVMFVICDFHGYGTLKWIPGSCLCNFVSQVAGSPIIPLNFQSIFQMDFQLFQARQNDVS
jgi:hypothetical protein